MDEQEFLNKFTEFLGPTMAHLGKGPGMREVVQRYFDKLDVVMHAAALVFNEKSLYFWEFKKVISFDVAFVNDSRP